jgi:DNA-binding beta-propeller fold protein YncE
VDVVGHDPQQAVGRARIGSVHWAAAGNDDARDNSEKHANLRHDDIMRFGRAASNARQIALLLVTMLIGARSATAQSRRPTTPLPARDVDDPGVVATGQRITPAGLQMVVPGRVGGVRFGSGNELWVAAAGAAYRLDLSGGRVVARVAFRGRAGVEGVALDPKTGRAFVATIGPISEDTTIAPLAGAPARASLARNERAALLVIATDATGDSARAAASWALPGDYLTASPVIARDPSPDGRRLALALLPANDAALILDADSGSPLRFIRLGVLPLAAALSHDGAVAWIANFGGGQPTAAERAVLQCCLRRAERVRVDTRGIATGGSVMRVDISTGKVTSTIPVGRHANGLAWDEARGRLYVTSGVDDAVTVIDTRAARAVSTIRVAPFREKTAGVAPTALALSPSGDRLYVTLGGANAVAIYGIAADNGNASLLGLMPTAWYPSSIDVSSDGKRVAVGTLFGVGSGEGSVNGTLRARYVFAQRGTVHLIDVPDSSSLAAYTAAVAANNRLTVNGRDANLASARPRAGVPSRPVPERPGEPSPIENVVFIIRENRTYDQVLGDLGRGAGDSSLVMYGRAVTPNAHALAERYVTLDHFFASGGNSADGHQWITQANETEYPMWPLYSGRTYPSEGNDPLAYSPGGFLWETAQTKGKSVAVFGEYAPAASDSISRVRADLLARWTADSGKGPAVFRDLLRQRYRTRSSIPSLDRVLVREYPGWTQEVPDVVKAEVIRAHLADWERAKRMPHLVMIILPSDHTVGTSAGWCVPKACVADNDLALGRIVASLSASSFWKRMAILVVEDDAQNGVDHIDGHRTVALAISPYARRGIVDSTVYTQASMVKTIELMLGLPALSLFDLVATDMRASFIGPNEAPDFTPYSPIVPEQSLAETNPRPASIRGAFAKERRAAAIASARMRFDEPDAAPSDALNRILWHDARGYDVKFPGVRSALFFPLSVDIDDDDRELRKPSPPTRKR